MSDRVNMTAADARHRLYLVSYALEELSRATESAVETGLSNTLEVLSLSMEDAIAVIHPYIPDPIRHEE